MNHKIKKADCSTILFLVHAFELVGESVTEYEAANLFAEYDKSGDNVIYLEDWVQAMRTVNISI